MSFQKYTGGFLWPVGVVIIVSLTVIIIVMWIVFANAAQAGDIDRPCLTKAQAQAKWPGQWMYWHGLNKCWDNVSTRGRYAQRETQRVATWGKQNSLKLAKPNPDPNGNVTHHSGRPLIVDPPAGPTVAYPSLMPGAGTTPDMMRPDNMKGWPLIVDFDVDPPKFIPWDQRVSFLNEQ
jgi:hypothetical protein